MGEIAIKFFGFDFPLRDAGNGRFVQEVGRGLKIVWEANELALIAGSTRVQPTAAAETAQEAATILEERLSPLRALFVAPDLSDFAIGPVPMALHCPLCGAEHVDPEGAPAHTEHCCLPCGHSWTPFDFETIGVATNGDEAEVEVSYSTSGHDGPGWYYWDENYPDDGSCGAFESFEEAARHAATAYYRVRPPALARPAPKETANA